MMRKTGGFTLVELLVVIGIMMVLTTITVSQFTTARLRAADVQRKADLTSLSRALLAYFNDFGSFPSSITFGGTLVNETDGYVYMKVLPRENYQTRGVPEYCYVVDVNRVRFALFAKLEVSSDPDCVAPVYEHSGNEYCYAVVSPNAAASDFNGLDCTSGG